MKSTLDRIYQKLSKSFGPQHWWPAQTRFEVIVGAVLTQNTNWGNVERALNNLKRKRLLNPDAIHRTSRKQLASLIKPSGYFNVKAKRLKNFIDYMYKCYDGDLNKMKRQPLKRLRHEFLEVNGVGPETADSILLYAFNKPVFVVDAYTKRIFSRHNIVEKDATYHQIQEFFMDRLKANVKHYNEYHALIVNLGKDYCKPKPSCETCPINKISYSLKNKCSQCHVALTGQVRKRTNRDNKLLCAECDASGNF